MSAPEATVPTTEAPVAEVAKTEEAVVAPVVEAPKEEAVKPVEEAAAVPATEEAAVTEEAKPAEEAKEAATPSSKKEKRQSAINKFFGLFNKKEKTPKKEIKSDETAKTEETETAAAPTEAKAEETAPVVKEAETKPEETKVEEPVVAAPATEEGVKIDDAAKKEDATAPTAAQKEKLSRRLSARVGGLFNKPKKEAATEAETEAAKPAEVTNEKIEVAAPKAPEAATPVTAAA